MEYISILLCTQLMKSWNLCKRIPKDTTTIFHVRNKFKSKSYIKLSKDLWEVQNGNQKFDLKRSDLMIRKRFSCQRYILTRSQKVKSHVTESSGNILFIMIGKPGENKVERNAEGDIHPDQ